MGAPSLGVVMPHKKSSRYRAALKHKKAKERLRCSKRLSKRRPGGRLVKVARKAKTERGSR